MGGGNNIGNLTWQFASDDTLRKALSKSEYKKFRNEFRNPKTTRINGKPHIYKNAERICERFENECIAIVSEGVRYKK